MKSLKSKLLVPLVFAGLVLGCGGDSKKIESSKTKKPDTTHVVQMSGLKEVVPKNFLDSLMQSSNGKYVVKKGNNLDYLGERIYSHPVMGHAVANWNGVEIYDAGSSHSGDFYAKLNVGDSLKVKDVEVRTVLRGWTWNDVAEDCEITVEEALDKFAWIGSDLEEGDVYYIEKSSGGKLGRGWGGEFLE